MATNVNFLPPSNGKRPKFISAFVFIISILLFSTEVFATTYYARADKDWNDVNAWSTTSRSGSAAGTIPGTGDIVIIDAKKIDIDAANVTIATLIITNAGNGTTSLRMQNGYKLTVTGNMTVTAENKDKTVDVYLEDNGSEIEVQGNLTFDRAANNNRKKRNQLSMEQSTTLRVIGDFIIDHQDSHNDLDEDDMDIEDGAIIICESDVYLNITDGGDLKIEFNGSSSWQIDGNVISTVSGGDKLEIKTKDNASITVNGNFTHTQTGGDDFKIKAENSTTGTEQIHILGNLLIDHDAGEKVEIEAKNKGEIAIGGDFTIDWDGSSASSKEMKLKIEDNGVIDVDGSMSINVNDPNNAKIKAEFKDNGKLQVGVDNGILTESADITLANGSKFELKMDHDSQFEVYGNLDLVQNGNDELYIYLNQSNSGSTTDAQLLVDGNLTISKGDGDEAYIFLEDDADINVGGDLNISFSGFDAGWKNAEIQLENNATITALGNLSVTMNDTRQNSLIFDLDHTSAITIGVNDGSLAKSATINVTDGYQLLFDLDRDSKFQVYGNFHNTFNGTDSYEFDLNYNSNGSSADGQLAIDGNWTLTKTNGDFFRLRAKNTSDIKVGGNFNVTSTGHDNGAWDDESIYLTNDATLDVNGSFSYSLNDPNKQNDLIIDLDYDAAFYVGTNDGAFAYSATFSMIEGLDYKLQLDRNAKFQVFGDLIIDYSANQEFSIDLNRSTNGSGTDAQLLVGRNFTITKTDGYGFELYQGYSSDINVGGNFTYAGTNHKSGWWDDETIRLYNDATFSVAKNFSFSMNDGTNQNDLLLYLYDNTVLNTGTTTNHTATITQYDGNNMEIYLASSAIWNNAGDLYWNYTDGTNTSYANLNNNSELNVGGDFIITNAQNSSEFSIYVNTSALLNVDGNIDVSSAATSNRIEIELDNSSKLELGGSFIRSATPNNYGKLWMASNATLEFNGTSSQVFPQENGAGTDDIYLTNVIINNTASSTPQLTMEGNNTVQKTIVFTDGVVSSTSSNMLKLADNGSVTSASNASYVDGLFGKIGNNIFTFPIGDNGYYAPITMTAASNNSDEFDASYVNSSPHDAGFDTTSTAVRIDHISKTEYWLFNRAVGSANVKATLGWNRARSGDIGEGTLCDIRLTRWDGSAWLNEGNGGTSGNSNSGTIITGSSYDCTTSTNVSSWVNNAPITLAIDSNYITWDGLVYDGGSGTSGAPNTSDATRILKVFGTNAVVTADASVDNVIITSSGSITIRDGVKVTVNGIIINEGIINIENNGSLIQTTLGVNANEGSGIYNVNRTGNNSANTYNIWSSPISDADVVTSFSGTNPCDIWVFDQNNQAWTHDYTAGFSTTCYGNSVTFTASDVITGGDGIMNQGVGYFIPGAAIPTRQYSGQVNNGDYLVPISITSLLNPGGSNWGADDWNLIGNPYPSALDATAFWNENAVNNSRITDAIYFWDDNRSGTGYNQNSDYASWNLLGGVNSGNSSTIPTGNVASGQGFWVIGNANTNVVFNNSMRNGDNDQFFKNNNTEEKHLAWVSVVTPNGYTNNVLVGYSNNSTDQVDPLYDAHKLEGNAHVRFASLIGTEEFSIQGFKALNIGDSKVIPLVLFTDDSGIHTFSKYHSENLPINFKVYLKDLVTGIQQDLTSGDYTVTLNGNQEYLNRFELVFENSINNAGTGNGTKDGSNGADTTTTVTGINENTNSNFTVTQNENDILIANQNGINGSIQIFDVTGKLVWVKENLNNQVSQTINLNSISSGTYFITIVENEKMVYTKQWIRP